MRRVRCYECGKRYDFDADDFCPRCGAFNPPGRSSRIDADGNVVRLDGLNEVNHRESFVHAELHEENKERRASGLSKSVKRSQQKAAARRDLDMAVKLGVPHGTVQPLYNLTR